MHDVDLAIEPKGHIVADLYDGPVRVADLFRAYPYGYDASDALGFRMASYTLTGRQLLTALTIIMIFVDPENGAYDYLMQANGLDYQVDYGADGLRLHEDSVFVNSLPIDKEATYRIASSDRVVRYLRSLFSIEPEGLVIHPKSVLEILEKHVKENGLKDAVKTGHLRQFVVTTSQEELPRQSVRILPNYPNPFQTQTSIPVKLSADGWLSVVVYDLLGRRVMTLYDGVSSAGIREFVWNGSDAGERYVSQGISLIRAVFDGDTGTRMITRLH